MKRRMKRRWITLGLALLAVLATAGCARTWRMEPAAADDGVPPPGAFVDVSYFYDALAPYGEWFWHDIHGWVWWPYDVPGGWQPYTYGEWIWTSYGWTWVSDWPWGWAAEHYGRWFDDPYSGWCWVPGEEWAPAWVAWREVDGWIGWAPLPPEAAWLPGGGFDVIDWNRLPSADPYWWSFCPLEDLPGRRVYRRLAPREQAPARYKNSRDVTRYKFVDARVVNGSLDRERVQRARGRPIPTYRVEELSSPTSGPERRPERDTYYVYRPRLAAAPVGRKPPLERAVRSNSVEPEGPAPAAGASPVLTPGAARARVPGRVAPPPPAAVLPPATLQTGTPPPAASLPEPAAPEPPPASDATPIPPATANADSASAAPPPEPEASTPAGEPPRARPPAEPRAREDRNAPSRRQLEPPQRSWPTDRKDPPAVPDTTSRRTRAEGRERKQRVE